MKQIHVTAEAITIACCRNDLATAQLLQTQLQQRGVYTGVLVCEPQSPHRKVDFRPCRVMMVLRTALSVRINDLRHNESWARLAGTFLLPIGLDGDTGEGGTLPAIPADRDFPEVQLRRILAALELPLTRQWSVRLHCFNPLSAEVNTTQLIRELDAACAHFHGRLRYERLPEGTPPSHRDKAILCYTDEMIPGLPEPFNRCDPYLRNCGSSVRRVDLVTEMEGRELMYSTIFMCRCDQVPGASDEACRQDAARVGEYIRTEIIGEQRRACAWQSGTVFKGEHERWTGQVAEQIIDRSLSEQFWQEYPKIAKHPDDVDGTSLPFAWEPRDCGETRLTERVTSTLVEARYLLIHHGHPGPWERFQGCIQPGDELWRYAEPPSGYERSMCGYGANASERRGIALVREGRIFAKVPNLG